MSTSSKLDENWTKTTDAGERRRIQNRLAQRNYRNNIKQRLRQLEQLEQLDKTFSESVSLNAGTISRDENDEDEPLHQQHNITAYPISQPLAVRPDNSCSWLSNQNEITVTGHTEIQMDMTSQRETNQYIFGLNTPHATTPHANTSLSSQSQHQQYSYFTNPSPPQEQHLTLTFDRQISGQATLPSGTQPQYQNRHASVGTKPDAATHSNLSTPPNSEKGSVGSRFGNTAKIITVPQYPATPASGTPLHQAAANGHLQIVRFLVSKGANLAAPNEAGQTVLHLAAERGHEGVIEYALTQYEGSDSKAFIDKVDDQGFTALHRAAAGGHEECVLVLVEAGAEIESPSR